MNILDNVLNISANVANKILTPNRVFYVEQGRWVDDKTVDFVILYHASNAQNELVISRCECKKSDCLLVLEPENICISEDDAIAMALNAV